MALRVVWSERGVRVIWGDWTAAGMKRGRDVIAAEYGLLGDVHLTVLEHHAASAPSSAPAGVLQLAVLVRLLLGEAIIELGLLLTVV